MEERPHVPGAEAEPGLGRRQQPGDVGMGHLHPARPPGRARGIDDVGQVLRAYSNRGRRSLSLSLSLRLVQVNDRAREAVRRRRGSLGDDERGSGVGKEEAQALPRIGGVKRQVGTAGLENAQNGDDETGRALQADSHHPLRPHPPRRQAAGQPVRLAVEIAIGQAFDPHHEGRRSRGAPRLLGENLVQAAAGRPRRFDRRDQRGDQRDRRHWSLLDGELVALGRRQERQRRDRRPRPCRSSGEEHREARRPALDGRTVEELAPVVEEDLHPALGLRLGRLDLIERDIEEVLPVTDEQIACLPGLNQGPLEDGDGVDRRPPEITAGRELLDQLLEGVGLVPLGSGDRLVHPRQGLGERRIAAQIRAERGRGDEKAHLLVESGVGTAGELHGDQEVGRAGQPGKQHRESRGKGAEEGRAGVRGEPFQAIPESGPQGEEHRAAGIGRRGGAGPVERQVEARGPAA